MILGVASLDLWHRLLRDCAGLHGCHVLGITWPGKWIGVLLYCNKHHRVDYNSTDDRMDNKDIRWERGTYYTVDCILQWATKPMQCLHNLDWWVNIGRPIDARPIHIGMVRKHWSRAFKPYIHWLGNPDSIWNYSEIKQGYSLHQFCCWHFEVWKLCDEVRYYIINGSCDTL